MTAELVSLNQTMCGEMAVGPSVEKLKDSATIEQSTVDENCIGLPYEDHNYGRIPSQYPLSSLVGHSVNSSEKMCLKPSLPVMESRNNHKFHPNGLIKQNCISSKYHKKKSYTPESEVNRDVTRCICGFSHDDGYMISCDQCSVWQHIDCVNIDRNNIPDTYLCDGCNPRRLNKEEAIQLQAKKLNDLSIVSEFESSGAESADDRDQSAVTYTAIQSTPTSLTITSNRNSKKTESIGTGRKRKRSRDDNKRPGKKASNFERKRSRSTSKGSLNDAHTDEQIGTFTWARKLKEWSESYREIDENHYTSELLQAVLSSSGMPINNCKSETNLLKQLRNQLAKVKRLRNTVLAMEDISMSKPILELKGSYMLSNQSEAAKPGLYKRPYPYLFFYNGFDGLEIVVDCRFVGNVARYLRRSCKPNSEVRHVIERSQLRLFVYSKDYISSGSEITIPFDFKYQNCLYDVECGCGLFKDCPVYKFTNMRTARNQTIVNSNKHSKSKENDGRVSPLRLSISRISEHVNGYPGSDHDNSNVADNDQDSIHQENLRKKSREDRKIEFYIRAFERLEEKEKRKELHQSISGSVDSKLNLKENSRPSIATSISQPSTPSSTANEDKPSPLSTHPLKRTSRRRSTKTGRRSSRKLRTTSHEGVLSPTLSLDNNDSNQSMDCVSMAQDSTCMSSISEQNDSLQLVEISSGGLVALESDADSLTTRQTSSVSANPDDFPIVTSQTNATSVAVSTVQSNSGAFDTCITNTTTSEMPSPVDDHKHLPVVALPSIETDTQETSIPTSKQVKKKAGNSESTGNSKQDSSNSFSHPSCCTFKNWEYRPGVPNGKVHVGIGGLPGWKYFDRSLHLKKSWLRLANEEDLIPKPSENDGDMTKDLELNEISYKKRLLRTYRKNEKIPGALSESSQNNAEATDGISFDQKQAELLQKSDYLPTNHCDYNKMSSGLQAPGGIQQPPCTTIEYESLSEDEEDPDSDKPSLAAGDAECGVYENKTSMLNDFRAGLPSANGEKQSILAATEDNVNVTSKKKVSIQEYLKRTKEQRRNSLAQQTPIKPVSLVPTTIAATTASDTLTLNPVPNKDPGSDTTPTETAKPTHSPVVSPQASPTPAGSPVTVKTTSADKHLEEHETIRNSSTKNTEKLISNAASQLEDKTQQSDIQEIMDALSDDTALKKLPPELLVLFNDFIKTLPLCSQESSKEKQSNKNKNSIEEKSKKVNSEKGSSKKPASVHRKETTKSQATPTSVRPLVERSNSSPSVRHVSRHGTMSSHQTKKISGSQDNSPSSRHSTPGNRKIFTSPTPSVSPRLIRGQSGSSLNSHSPTPTVYDRRHRTECTGRDTSNGGKSRHSSGTSDNTGKSPKSAPPDSSQSQAKHSSSVSSQDQKPTSRTQDLPQKVPSITPAVPGQPIPSLARGPGTVRVPQVVYTRRPSPPRIDGSSPSWDPPHLRDPPPARLLKDVPYNRHEPYYSSRMPSPPPTDRSSRDKYYNRYPPLPPPHSMSRPVRREDDPSHLGYYHHPYPSDYRSERTAGYYPPRESRPPSPVPFPRPGTEYYHRSSGYYPPPPQDYRR